MDKVYPPLIEATPSHVDSASHLAEIRVKLVGKYLAISYEKQTIRKRRENDLKMKILSVVETSIYVDDLDATEDFYQRILGLEVIAKESGRHVFFQVGDANVLLAFNPQTTCTGDTLPHHGATGPGHLALGIESQSLDDWRRHLEANDVSIETEVQWPAGGKSIYFRDPAGNSVELITPGVWQLPSGW